MVNQRVYHAARLLVQAGVSVIPIGAIGPSNPKGKKPALPSWDEYKVRRPTEDELTRWFNGTSPPRGLAMIGGTVSGNLEFVDFDEEGIYDRFLNALPKDVRAIVVNLPRTETPSGGHHIAYRCEISEPGQKLAYKIGEDGKPVHGGVETRGEGQYAVCPPSPGCVHPSDKPYKLVGGSPLKIPMISPAIRQVILDTCRTFNEYVAPKVEPRPPAAPPRPAGDLRPGDDYNQHRGLVHQVLLKHGWTMVKDKGARGSEWRHPTATADSSGGLDQNDGFNVFSTNALPFEAGRSPGYSPYEVYVLLEHNGDFTAATRELGKLGYGSAPLNPNTLNGHHPAAPVAPAGMWASPTPLDSAPTIPFPLCALPDALRLYVESVSKTTEVPVDLIAMSAIGVCSAAIRGRAYVQVGKTHQERLVMFIIALMPSGHRKSEALRRLTKPIFTYQSEARQAAEDENEKIKGDIRRLKREIQKKEQELKKSTLTKSEAEALDQEILKLETKVPQLLRKPQIIANDITPEALAAIMSRAEDNSMCVMSAEGKFFANMAGIYNGGHPNLDIALQSYDGEFIVINRKGQTISEDGVDGGEIIIDNPCLNFVTIVQPGIIRDLLGIRAFKELGFVGRCLFVYHPDPEIGTEYRDIPVDIFAYNAYENMLLRLLGMMLAKTKEDPSRRLEISLKGEALDVWAVFYAKIQKMRLDRDVLDDTWAAKHAARAVRIAGVLHMTQHAADYGEIKDPISSFEDIACNTPISPETMRNAVAIAEYALPQTMAALGINTSADRTGEAKMLKVIERMNKPQVIAADVAVKLRDVNPDDFKRQVYYLCACGYLRPVNGQPGMYDVNPLILVSKKEITK